MPNWGAMQHFSRPVHGLVKESKLSVTNQILTLLISNWGQVCDDVFKDITLPYKIIWAKKQHQQEKERKQATLHILCPDAFKTKLMFQEAVIVERANRVVGNPIFTNIQTRHHDDWQPPARVKETKKQSKENPFTDILNAVDDPDLRRTLTRISQAIADEHQ